MRYRFMRFPGGKVKAVTLSYDDGVVEDKRFSDVITKHGLKCTFNLNGINCRKTPGLTYDDVREYILSRGHEVAVHGLNHKAEGRVRYIEGIHDVLLCRLELEKELDMIIRGMAYPDSGITSFVTGTEYEGIKNYLKELDIVYARSLDGDNDRFSMPSDWHNWLPTVHHSNPKTLEYIDKFVNLDVITPRYNLPRLFYLWGHSYEFERNGNWELLDAICEALAGKDDIWYATNGEIYEYTHAYESLVYSADSSKIYNPTLYELFFNIDGAEYSIKPGETLRLS